MENISFTKAAKAIRALGFRVSRDADGEIRVGFPGNESAAYYTTDPADALGTAQAMREQADAGAVPVTDPEGEAVESGEHIPGEPWDGPATFDPEPVRLSPEARKKYALERRVAACHGRANVTRWSASGE